MKAQNFIKNFKAPQIIIKAFSIQSNKTSQWEMKNPISAKKTPLRLNHKCHYVCFLKLNALFHFFLFFQFSLLSID
jgi:hypothetical protein